MDITRHNKPQRKHPAPRAPDDTYRITEVYYDTHEEAKKHTAVDCDTDRVPANMGRKR